MIRQRHGTALAAMLIAAVLQSTAAQACGPFPLTAWFWLTRTPNVPLDRYLAGEIGILDPRLEPAYQFVAYRYLSGLGLDAQNQSVLRSYWTASDTDANPLDTAIQQWQVARDQVPGVQPARTVFPFRLETWVSYPNCLRDAFVTAVNTLDERIRSFGAASSEVHGWVEAQDLVFSNCEHGASIPESLPDDAPAPARADRAYQIAAANFYAGRLVEAERRFRQIAQDPASPWRMLSAYMVARALIRQSTIAEQPNRDSLSAAAGYLNERLADPDMASMQPALRRLAEIVQTDLDPAARLHELAAQLTQPSLQAGAAHALGEYLWLLPRYPALRADDVFGLAVQRAIGADAPLPAESPAALTASYYHAVQLVTQGRRDEARAELDRVLTQPDQTLSLGDRNRVRNLRAPLASELAEFLQLAQALPVTVGYDDGSSPILGAMDKPESASRALFVPYAAQVVDRSFPLALMVDVVRRDDVTPYLRRRVTLTAWTRAVLTDDYGVATDLLPHLRTLAPELRPDLDAYQIAAAGPARQFTMALMLLRFPGLQPAFGDPVGREQPIERLDDFRDNWWCAPGTTTTDEAPAPPFVTAEQRAAAAATRATVDALGAAPIYLGRVVLRWAEMHPHDVRVPEALHLVVRATRYGCANDPSAISKAAFQLLHRRYPDNEWTAKTPFWFR